MSLGSFIVGFFTFLFATIIAGILSSICSCYYPFLLSRGAYYVVKSKRMQKILISAQCNRSPDSKTAPEDRNKMAFLGCIGWLITFIWALCFGSLLIYLRIMDMILPRAESLAIADQWTPLFMCFFRIEYLYFFCLIFLFYQIDYAMGKHIHSKKS